MTDATTRARETALEAVSLAKAGDWAGARRVIAAVTEAGREGVAAAVDAWCVMVIERVPAPAPETDGQLPPDWATCWADWVVSARRRKGEEFFDGLFAELVGSLPPGTPMEAMCLSALLGAAAVAEYAGEEAGAEA